MQHRDCSIVIKRAGEPVAAMVDMTTYENVLRNKSGEFERLWAEFAKGFDDLTDTQAQTLADDALAEARNEIAKRPSDAAKGPHKS